MSNYVPKFKPALGSKWSATFRKLTWGKIVVKLLGTDQCGFDCLKVQNGQGEPIYLRVREKTVEVIKEGKLLG